MVKLMPSPSVQSYRVAIPLLSIGIGFAILADLLHGLTLIGGYNPIKLLGMILVFLGSANILKKARFKEFPGLFALIVLSIFPLLVHGYVNLGLFFHVLLVLVVVSSEVHFQSIARAVILFFSVILILVIMGVFLTGNPFYLRGGGLPSAILAWTPLVNPNVVSRTIIIMIPLLFLARLYGLVGSKTWMILLAGAVITIVVIASSRANILALLIMFIYWGLFGRSRISIRRLARYSLMAFLLVVAAFSFSALEEKIERASYIISSSYHLFHASARQGAIYDQAPARAKSWIASILVFKDNPWVGVGLSAKEELEQRGAVKNDKTIAVHGGFMNILVSTGALGLALYLFALFQVYRGLGGVGRMFILGTMVSQVGADIYTHTLFWLVLGLLIVFDAQRKFMKRNYQYSESESGSNDSIIKHSGACS